MNGGSKHLLLEDWEWDFHLAGLQVRGGTDKVDQILVGENLFTLKLVDLPNSASIEDASLDSISQVHCLAHLLPSSPLGKEKSGTNRQGSLSTVHSSSDHRNDWPEAHD